MENFSITNSRRDRNIWEYFYVFFTYSQDIYRFLSNAQCWNNNSSWLLNAIFLMFFEEFFEPRFFYSWIEAICMIKNMWNSNYFFIILSIIWKIYTSKNLFWSWSTDWFSVAMPSWFYNNRFPVIRALLISKMEVTYDVIGMFYFPKVDPIGCITMYNGIPRRWGTYIYNKVHIGIMRIFKKMSSKCKKMFLHFKKSMYYRFVIITLDTHEKFYFTKCRKRETRAPDWH